MRTNIPRRCGAGKQACTRPDPVPSNQPLLFPSHLREERYHAGPPNRAYPPPGGGTNGWDPVKEAGDIDGNINVPRESRQASDSTRCRQVRLTSSPPPHLRGIKVSRTTSESILPSTRRKWYHDLRIDLTLDAEFGGRVPRPHLRMLTIFAVSFPRRPPNPYLSPRKKTVTKIQILHWGKEGKPTGAVRRTHDSKRKGKESKGIPKSTMTITDARSGIPVAPCCFGSRWMSLVHNHIHPR